MKIEYINPFIEGAHETFSTMCNVKAERAGELKLVKKGIAPAFDLIGIIGLSGIIRGAVLMTMPPDLGRKLVKNFLSEDDITDADLMDGFGEILNIISGAAAAKLGKVKLALPAILIGKQPEIYSKQTSPWVVIPMKFADWDGVFNIEVAVDEL